MLYVSVCICRLVDYMLNAFTFSSFNAFTLLEKWNMVKHVAITFYYNYIKIEHLDRTWAYYVLNRWKMKIATLFLNSKFIYKFAIVFGFVSHFNCMYSGKMPILSLSLVLLLLLLPLVCFICIECAIRSCSLC